MPDVHDSKTRSYNMSQIRGCNTKPEIMVRKYLFSKGLRFRLHDKKLSGKPDIVLPKYKSLIFVHGCFWHGHESCKYFVVPQTRTDFWMNKINANIANDKKNSEILKQAGWKIFTIWECESKKDEVLNELLKQIRNA